MSLKESHERFLGFINEAAMRHRNPLEIVEENLAILISDIERGEFESTNVSLILKILLCRNRLKLFDAPGASPRRWGAPVAIVLYYLFKKMREVSGQVISRHRMRHEPPTGAGLAQGGQPNLMKQVFYRALDPDQYRKKDSKEHHRTE